MSQYLLNKTRTAQGPIQELRFVKPGTAPYTAIQASSGSDSLIGVCMQFFHPRAGEQFDFVVLGQAQIELGGTVNDGDLLTSDAEGRAITAVRHAHVENTAAAYTENATTNAAPAARVGAMALMAGNLGDVIDVVVLPNLG
jgi:hypothetical protein